MDPAEAARARQDPETIVVNAPVMDVDNLLARKLRATRFLYFYRLHRDSQEAQTRRGPEEGPRSRLITTK